jgi:hypothetical protein
MVANVGRSEYQYGGPGFGTSVGLDVRVVGALSLVGQYKLTVAKPQISIADGTGRMWAVTHQAAVGFAFGF